MVKVGDYDYPDDAMETSKINKVIKKDFSNFCRQNKLNKSKLVEEFFKTILLRSRDGSLDATRGYVTIDIMRMKKF